jgi:alpha-tubulin suppressor-like RCC1 family protein
MHKVRRSVALGVVALVAAVVAVDAGAGDAAPAAGPGSVLTFGSNQYGQLGITSNTSTTNPNPTPTLVALPGQDGRVTELATGQDHSLVLTASGQLYAFGSNSQGQLGVATNAGSARPNPAPALVALPGQNGAVTQVSAGGGHSLALTAGDQLYAFGSNSEGELGNPTNISTSNPNPTPTPVGLPGQVGHITQVSAGAIHTLVSTSSGQLYAFGYNYAGQVGNPDPRVVQQPTPTLVALPGEVGQIAKISAGGEHNLILTSSGQVYAFGQNPWGELGNTTNNSTVNPIPNPTPTPVTLPGQIGQVTQVAAADDHSLVLTSSNQLYAFGTNYYGELGTTTNVFANKPNSTPTPVKLPGEIGPITQIAGGDHDTFAVTASGQLFAFGWDAYGDLGPSATLFAPNPAPALVSLPAGTTIDAVSVGSDSNHLLALVSDLAIGSTTLAPAKAGTAYREALAASGGGGTLHWSATALPAGLTIDPASGAISGTPVAAGTASPAVTVTDAYGIRATHTFALRVASASTSTPTTTTTTGTASTSGGAPRLTAFTQSSSRWKPGRNLPHLNGATLQRTGKTAKSVGTSFGFTLDRAAVVSFVFRHTTAGRRVGTSCVAPSAGNARKQRCTRLQTVGVTGGPAHEGANTLRFEGAVSHGVHLKTGRYSVSVVAVTTAGKSTSRTLHFTITAA